MAVTADIHMKKILKLCTNKIQRIKKELEPFQNAKTHAILETKISEVEAIVTLCEDTPDDFLSVSHLTYQFLLSE